MFLGIYMNDIPNLFWLFGSNTGSINPGQFHSHAWHQAESLRREEVIKSERNNSSTDHNTILLWTLTALVWLSKCVFRSFLVMAFISCFLLVYNFFTRSEISYTWYLVDPEVLHYDSQTMPTSQICQITYPSNILKLFPGHGTRFDCAYWFPGVIANQIRQY